MHKETDPTSLVVLQKERAETQYLLRKEMDQHHQTRQLLHHLEASYGRFVPRQFLELLGKKNIIELELGDQVEKKMTILFSDIRSFASLSEKMTPQQNFDFINSYLFLMEPVIRSFHGVIDKYIGDTIMVLFPTGADDAVQGSLAMLRTLHEYNARYQPIQIGIGLNTGFSMLGTVGSRHRMEGTVISDAVHLADRIEELTKTYGISLLISEHTLYGLENSSQFCIRFLDRVKVRGKDHPQSVYEVFNNDEEEVRLGKTETLKIFEEALACYHLREIPRARRLLEQCLTVNAQDKPAQVYLHQCNRYLKNGYHESTGELDLNVQWKDRFSVGVPIIDMQHKQLLEKINCLSGIIRQRFDKRKHISELMDFLSEYADVHFWTEERFMQNYAYPFYHEHKKEHAKFEQYFLKLKELVDRAEEDRIYIRFQIQLFLTDWLINHTTKTDRHLGRFLEGKL